MKQGSGFRGLGAVNTLWSFVWDLQGLSAACFFYSYSSSPLNEPISTQRGFFRNVTALRQLCDLGIASSCPS